MSHDVWITCYRDDDVGTNHGTGSPTISVWLYYDGSGNYRG